VLEDDPDRRYTSDGDPETVTIPSVLPPILDGTFDREKAEADEKIVIIYDPETGAAT
jgi:hypothetical protein